MHYSIVAAYDWKCVHDEGFLIYEVAEVFGNVRYSLLNAVPLFMVGLLYSPGFFSRIKEKGTLAKDVWGVIGSV